MVGEVAARQFDARGAVGLVRHRDLD